MERVLGKWRSVAAGGVVRKRFECSMEVPQRLFFSPFASFSLPEGRGTAGAGVVRDSALIRVLFLFLTSFSFVPFLFIIIIYSIQ